MKRRSATWIGAGLFVLVCALDALTKWLAKDFLADAPITVIPGWAWLRLAFNRGVAFSALDGVPHWLLGVGAIGLLAFVAWNLREAATRRTGAAALALVGAGGLSNAIDRLMDGQVTDMISVWIWPVFNVADIAITVGVGLLFLTSRRHKEEKRAEAAPVEPPPAESAAVDADSPRA